MKIEWVNENSGRSGLVVTEVDRYDGVPSIDSFWLDHAPLNLSQDRVAVATTLVFGRWAMGAFRLPKQVGAGTAKSIIRYLEPNWVVPEPIDYGPKPIPNGPATLYVSSVGSGNDVDFAAKTSADGIQLRILSSDKYSGAISTMSSLSVAANAFAFQMEGPGEMGLPLLAVAVLFAEDLQSTTIVLPATYSSMIGDEIRLRQLLSSVGLQLKFNE